MIQSEKKIVFLYTELAGYFISCLRLLVKDGVEVHLIHWPVNKEAPFNFDIPDRLEMYDRKDYDLSTLQKLVQQINPDIIISSGWMDKSYLSICKHYFGTVPTVLCLDNHWTGSLKQRMAVLGSPFYLLNKFSHAWVPGSPQQQFARKLGFKEGVIHKGFYSADYSYFFGLYEKNKEQKAGGFPKRFIYTGRYVKHKGIFDLWKAFIELQEENPNEWELWCLGTGDMYEKRVTHPKIKHFGFVQPTNLEDFIAKTGVFVLPSHFEPWGVVVHEFTAAGFPMICSDRVGAATEFLNEGENGYLFSAGNVPALKSCMKQVMDMPEKSLVEMGQRSVEKAEKITPEKWADTLMKMIADVRH